MIKAVFHRNARMWTALLCKMAALVGLCLSLNGYKGSSLVVKTTDLLNPVSVTFVADQTYIYIYMNMYVCAGAGPPNSNTNRLARLEGASLLALPCGAA